MFEDCLVTQLLEKEKMYRKQQRLWLNEMNIKIGRTIVQPKGGKYYEYFEEGDEFRKAKEKLEAVRKEKLDIERLKKHKGKGRSKREQGLMPPPKPMTEASEFDLEESEYNNVDKSE